MSGASGLAGLTLAAAHRSLRKGEISPPELVRAVLDRIDATDERTRSYVEVYREEAVEAAREVGASAPTGPLHGVPVAVKDVYDVKGRPTLCGSEARAGHVASEDAEVVRRLRRAGAVVVGKTVTREFAVGVVSPPSVNPWDLGRISGGSSGGSGAAVAADLCLAATGSDTAGSIRIPAALNGVVGLKPTYGRLSKRGVFPLAPSLDHAGYLTKTVEDAALLLQATAGHDPGDPSSLDEPVGDYQEALGMGLEGLRIGVPSNHFFDDLQPGVEAAVGAALRELEGLGARIEEVEVPDAELSRPVASIIGAAEAHAVHRHGLWDHPQKYSREVRTRLRAGGVVNAASYLDARRARLLVRDGFRAALSRVDALVAPSVPAVAAPVGARTVTIRDKTEPILGAYTRLASPANAAGLPALSVPCGFSGGGLPVGLQVIGRPLDEATVFRVGHAYEQATGWQSVRPPC